MCIREGGIHKGDRLDRSDSGMHEIATFGLLMTGNTTGIDIFFSSSLWLGFFFSLSLSLFFFFLLLEEEEEGEGYVCLN